MEVRLERARKRVREAEARDNQELVPLHLLLSLLDLEPGLERDALTACGVDLVALRAAADAIRSKAARAVILETHGNARLVDLTSTRRLALAAAETGVLALLVRGDAVPMPSAVSTRWRICSAPSVPLAGNAPGLPTFDISLLRHRGGTAPFETRVTWDHATRSFFDTPLSGGLSATVTDAEADPPQRFRA